MPNILTKQDIKEVSLSAKVVRCGCTVEQKQLQNWHGYSNTVCPNPKNTEDLGVIAYSSKNIFKYLGWKFKKLFKR